MTTISVPSSVYNNKLSFPSYVNILDATTVQDFTAPTGVKFVVVTCTPATTGMWIKRGSATAIAPAAAVSDGTGSFYVPVAIEIRVDEGGTISFIGNAAAGWITVACYS